MNQAYLFSGSEDELIKSSRPPKGTSLLHKIYYVQISTLGYKSIIESKVRILITTYKTFLLVSDSDSANPRKGKISWKC